jgi:ABC-type multidrug transport system permease subunit
MLKNGIDQFNWKQMFNNSKGKTSGTLVAGFIACMVSAGGFFASGNLMMIMVIFKLEKNSEVINFLNMMVMQSIVFFSLGGTLLGVHRLSKDKTVDDELPKE